MSAIEVMHRMFREQHRQMIEEQKRLLDDYKQYFEGVLQQMEEQEKATLQPATPPPKQEQEDALKEIAEIGNLLDDAVKTYGKELAEILVQLTERQRKKAETSLQELDSVTEVGEIN